MENTARLKSVLTGTVATKEASGSETVTAHA